MSQDFIDPVFWQPLMTDGLARIVEAVMKGLVGLDMGTRTLVLMLIGLTAMLVWQYFMQRLHFKYMIETGRQHTDIMLAQMQAFRHIGDAMNNQTTEIVKLQGKTADLLQGTRYVQDLVTELTVATDKLNAAKSLPSGPQSESAQNNQDQPARTAGGTRPARDRKRSQRRQA